MIFRVQQLCFKTRLKQTYTDFERIAELDPSMSSLKDPLNLNHLCYRTITSCYHHGLQPCFHQHFYALVQKLEGTFVT